MDCDEADAVDDMVIEAEGRIERLEAAIQWALERLGGFAPGSWESNIANGLRERAGL